MKLRIDLQFFAGEKTEKATPKNGRIREKKDRLPKAQMLILPFLY